MKVEKFGLLCCFCLLLIAGRGEGRNYGWKYLDLLFVVDGKISADDSWQYGKQFIKEVVKNTRSAIDSGSTQVGIMQYNYFVSMPIRMRADLSRRVMKHVDTLELRYMYFARLGKALHKASIVMDHHRLRGAPQLLVILSHSQSLDQFHSQLTLLKNQHIRTVMIDVGELYISTNIKDFVDHYFSLKDYSDTMDILPKVNTLVDQYSDLDECRTGQHNCHVHATCSNRKSGFECICMSGWYGNGTSCWSHNACEDEPSAIEINRAMENERNKNAKRRGPVIDHISIVRTREPEPTVEARWEVQNDLDIIFAIGASQSLGSNNFHRVKKLIMRAAENLTSQASEHTVQIGVATFTYMPRLKVPVRNWEIGEMKQRVKALRYRPGTILAEMALTKLNQILARHSQNNAQKVIVMILSGQSMRRVYQPLSNIQADGTKVIIISLESSTGGQSATLAEQFQNVIFMDSSSHLNAVVNKIARAATLHDDLT